MRDRLTTGALVAVIVIGCAFGAPTTPPENSAPATVESSR